MIHGGLEINLKKSDKKIFSQQCCLRNTHRETNIEDIWVNKEFEFLREKNNNNNWDPGCWTCQGNELAGLTSFRTGMYEKFGRKKNLSGPQRLDLLFDIGCNLACRTCSPDASTFWQKHLKENNIQFHSIKPTSDSDRMIEILKTLDLSNLEMVVFCGGETLMGAGYWEVADYLINNLPDADKKLTISFQTNGTMPVHKKYHELIEKCHLVKLHISLDGVGEKFEYLRWPANWNQFTDNISKLKETMPVNTMFLIEETISIFNLFYFNDLNEWVKNNFSTNRLGDPIAHTRHIAHGIFNLNNITIEYLDNLNGTTLRSMIPNSFKENPTIIKKMIDEINKFDMIRNQDWKKTFPEVASFYSRYS